MHHGALLKIVEIIDQIDFKSVNSRMLAFLISCYGKNCIQDEKVNWIKSLVYKQFRDKKANIFDIVEVFNTLLNLNMFTVEDLI